MEARKKVAIIQNPKSKIQDTLRRHPDFIKLWSAHSISEFGSKTAREALPLAALLTLGAGPGEMALLGVAGVAPVIVVGLLAGVWVDRLHRRPIMIITDLGRAFLLLSSLLSLSWGSCASGTCTSSRHWLAC